MNKMEAVRVIEDRLKDTYQFDRSLPQGDEMKKISWKRVNYQAPSAQTDTSEDVIGSSLYQNFDNVCQAL